MKAVGVFLLIVVMMGVSLEDEDEMDEDVLEDYYGSNDEEENATTVTMTPKLKETTLSAEGSG